MLYFAYTIFGYTKHFVSGNLVEELPIGHSTLSQHLKIMVDNSARSLKNYG